jgi:predicted RNA-binding Zn-ribbon protein involved in translation (DUF1610 family)
MPLNFVIDEICPTCGGTIRRAVIDRDPTDRDAAIHFLRCADCGYEKTTVLSLRAAAAWSLEEAASVGAGQQVADVPGG